MTKEKELSYNLWTEPWITLEKSTGEMEQLGIEQTLKNAHQYRCIYEQSPLVIVGIHRLLVAILQYILDPQENEDLRQLWRNKYFPANPIENFGAKYAHRFDLFSIDEPFMQSAELSIKPIKKDQISYISKLTFEIPSGSYVSHYYHGEEHSAIFCPACVAKQLLCLPAFATSGGPGIKPSINGIPPIYIIPGGRTLFESLTASLLTPQWLPHIANRENDKAWWLREPMIIKNGSVVDVGYLQSLTFPARKIRLHPEEFNLPCSRCGDFTRMGVRTMIYQMGEVRPKGSEVWMDPFVAYRSDTHPIKPVRPSKGKVLWREFSALFMQNPDISQRPEILEQITELEISDISYPFRCVGMRTEKQAKIVEWLDSGFEVPIRLLTNVNAGIEIRAALVFASEMVEISMQTFKEYVGEKTSGSRVYQVVKKQAPYIAPMREAKKTERYLSLRQKMEMSIWDELSQPFRNYILQMSGEDEKGAKEYWAKEVFHRIEENFRKVTDGIGISGINMQQSETAKKVCRSLISIKRKEYLNG